MLVCGRNVSKELLEKDEKIKKAFLQDGFNEKEIISLLENKNIKIEYFRKYEDERFQNMKHQGIVLEIEDFKYSDLEEFSEGDSLIILDHLEDPHNLGAIIRTAEAFSIDGVIIPKDRSASVNYTVMKTSAGALSNMKVAQVTNINTSIKRLKEMGYWIVGASLDAKLDFRKVDYSGKIAIVIGNEGKGISKSTLNHLDYNVKIPMSGEVNSLNASVAAALMIFELVRNRGI